MDRSTEPLDSRDLSLLAHLRNDARASISTLAAAIHLSETAVRRRLRRLEDSGVITGYTLKKSPGQAGNNVLASIEIQLNGRRCTELAGHLQTDERVHTFRSLAGDVDSLLHVEASDMEDLNKLVDSIAALPFVEKVTTRTVLETLIDR